MKLVIVGDEDEIPGWLYPAAESAGFNARAFMEADGITSARRNCGG